MATQQAQSDGQRSPWQQAYQGSPIAINNGGNAQHNTPTLSPPLLTSQSGHRYADYTAPKLSPAHVSGTFAQSHTTIMNPTPSPPFDIQAFSNPPSGHNSPHIFQQHHQQNSQPQSGNNSPFGNAYSFQSARPPISVMTSQPGTPSYNQNMHDTSSSSSTLAMPMPLATSQAGMMSSTSTFAYLTAGILDPTSMVYDENSGGYATPSYAGSYADDSSFDERRSHSPFDSRPDSKSPNNQFDGKPALSNGEPAFPKNASDLLAFRDSVQQGKPDWDDLSSLGGQDHVSTSRSSPSGHMSSPDISARQQQASSNFEGHGLEMAVERMFAPITSPRLQPEKENTLRATSAPPPDYQGISAPVSARSIFTASPAHSPVLRAQSDRPDNGIVPSIPGFARFSPSPTAPGSFLQQQQQQEGQPSLRSPPLPHLNNQSSGQENKNASLAPLAIPDKPDLTLTTATPTAIPRTATARQDSTQAALDTVFSTFFQRPANRQDSKDSVDSGPSNMLHAEAAQALFNDVPPHDLTLDLGAASRNRAMPTRQRSKSDTYMTSPTTFNGPAFSFAGPEEGKQNQQQQQHQQPSGAIDPRALDGSSPGWENFKASAMALQQHQGSALVTEDENDALTADLPSQAGPSSRRRSVVDSSPYDTFNLGGTASSQREYLVPPSPGGVRRSKSHGPAHKRGAQSEDYTASTFSPRSGQFGDLRTPHIQMPHDMKQEQSYHSHSYGQQEQQPGNRFLGGGYEPQNYGQNNNQYDISSLPPMPSAFLSGQENQYGLPTSSSGGNYSRQPSVDYGQQQMPPSYQGYLPTALDQYNVNANNHLLQHTNYPPYMPSGMSFDPASMTYNHSDMSYEQDGRFATGPDGLLDPGRMRRRSSVRSDTSGVSGISGVSDFTWESKTTEATKQAAKRRRKDPAAAKFVCEYCNETFTRAYNLKGHIRSHEGLKPFTCEVCNKGFARRHDLKRHELLHSGVKKYICEACQTPFVRLDALQRHHKSENGAACIQQIAAMAAVAGVDIMANSDDAQAHYNQSAHTEDQTQYNQSASTEDQTHFNQTVADANTEVPAVEAVPTQ